MRDSLKIGFGFGLTSGIITTLGLMVGLEAGTNSKLAVIGGVLTIAIADAFSDALGMHVSQESKDHHTTGEVWESTASTFLSKLVFAFAFIVPILLLKLSTAIVISVIWGLAVMCIFSYKIAREEKAKPWKVVSEHLLIALVVIIITHYVGDWVSLTFG